MKLNQACGQIISKNILNGMYLLLACDAIFNEELKLSNILMVKNFFTARKLKLWSLTIGVALQRSRIGVVSSQPLRNSQQAKFAIRILVQFTKIN